MSWLRTHKLAIAVSTILFFLGVGLGAAPSGDAEATAPETVTVEKTETVEKTVTVLDKLDAKQKKKLSDALAFVEKRKEKLAARGKTLEARAASLREKEAGLREREAAVSTEENRIAASTFSDGSYLVGSDIPAGSYVADGGTSGSCYWARMSGDNTDILDNHLSGGGQVRATVFEGEIFETRGCGTWQPG